MARIVVQTDDHRTVLEERHVQLADVDDGQASVDLMARLRKAVKAAERTQPKRPVRRLLTILPAADYREVSG
jgi:predicted short-subunit dehydrogenase-like oxidoreductase (DUF2520 family)